MSGETKTFSIIDGELEASEMYSEHCMKRWLAVCTDLRRGQMKDRYYLTPIRGTQRFACKSLKRHDVLEFGFDRSGERGDVFKTRHYGVVLEKDVRQIVVQMCDTLAAALEQKRLLSLA